jgi:hypothetical protein
MIGCHACNRRLAVWSEHGRPAEGRLGKRVGFTPSRVRIPHPPLLRLGETPISSGQFVGGSATRSLSFQSHLAPSDLLSRTLVNFAERMRTLPRARMSD